MMVFPQLSSAIYDRVISSGQEVPLDTSLTHDITGIPQLSVPTTNVISGAGTSVMQATVTAAGQVITGAIVSFTVMICVQIVVLLQLSSAIYVRVIISGQDVPLDTSFTQVTVGIAQLSVELTVEISGAGTSVIQATVTAGEQDITGGIVSLIVMI